MASTEFSKENSRVQAEILWRFFAGMRNGANGVALLFLTHQIKSPCQLASPAWETHRLQKATPGRSNMQGHKGQAAQGWKGLHTTWVCIVSWTQSFRIWCLQCLVSLFLGARNPFHSEHSFFGIRITLHLFYRCMFEVYTLFYSLFLILQVYSRRKSTLGLRWNFGLKFECAWNDLQCSAYWCGTDTFHKKTMATGGQEQSNDSQPS